MPSLIETSVLTFRFACVTAYTALVLTALACYICHMILFIFLICNVHGCNSTHFSCILRAYQHAYLLFLHSAFLYACFSFYCHCGFCQYAGNQFLRSTTYTCLKRSHLTRTTCGGWPGNSSGNLGEYLYRCHR